MAYTYIYDQAAQPGFSITEERDILKISTICLMVWNPVAEKEYFIQGITDGELFPKVHLGALETDKHQYLMRRMRWNDSIVPWTCAINKIAGPMLSAAVEFLNLLSSSSLNFEEEYYKCELPIGQGSQVLKNKWLQELKSITPHGWLGLTLTCEMGLRQTVQQHDGVDVFAYEPIDSHIFIDTVGEYVTQLGKWVVGDIVKAIAQNKTPPEVWLALYKELKQQTGNLCKIINGEIHHGMDIHRSISCECESYYGSFLY